MNSTGRDRKSQRGFTLLELLMVVLIAGLMIAVAVPVIMPQFRDRKIREATRQLSAMVAAAKAKALERDRPCGIWLERDSERLNNNRCSQIFLAEVPPPYSGDFLDATARLTSGTNQYIIKFTNAQALVGSKSNNMIPYLAKVGDRLWIRFSFREQVYPCVFQANPNQGDDQYLQATLLIADSSMTLPVLDRDMPFQVYFPPRKSSTTPLDLPTGIAVDLSRSGIGALGVDFDGWNAPNAFGPVLPDTAAIAIMFAPSGQVTQIYTRGTMVNPMGDVFLLAGQADVIPPLNPAGEPTNPSLVSPSYPGNLQDNSSLWISVGHRTGRVVTAENIWNPTTTNFFDNIFECRQFVRTAQTKGGG
ncbi:MAG: hypothetical protein RIS70_361 [Planctomycetota bacterium]